MAAPVGDRAEMVRAAGGLVWRREASGTLEVLVVHRPKYRDWSFPKGKRDPGETDEDCALREVWEETGYRCVLGTELAGTTYRDRGDRPKVVRYWAMTVTAGAFAPTREVDEIRWLAPGPALSLLTHERDRAVLDSLVATTRPEATVDRT